MMKKGAVLLAGGKSRRMRGHDKAFLKMKDQFFLEQIADELAEYEERLLSVGPTHQYCLTDFQSVRDIHPDCGPISGLHTALTRCRSEALLTVTCDIPLYTRDFGRYLWEQLTDDSDAVVVVTRDGRLHPFCGIYRKRISGLLERQILADRLCMLDALDRMKVHYASLACSEFPDDCMININTPEEYAQLLTIGQESRL